MEDSPDFQALQRQRYRIPGRFASRPLVLSLPALRQAVLPLPRGRRPRTRPVLRAAVLVRRQADHALEPGRPSRHRPGADRAVREAAPPVPGADRSQRAAVQSPPVRRGCLVGVRRRQAKNTARGITPRRLRANASGSQPRIPSAASIPRRCGCRPPATVLQDLREHPRAGHARAALPPLRRLLPRPCWRISLRSGAEQPGPVQPRNRVRPRR